MSEFFYTPGQEESLCYNCQLYDRIKGCLGLSDTYFPNYPCPFYKPFPPERKEPVFVGSDCRTCFAGTSTGNCRALTSKCDDGTCLFYKSIEAYENECRRCDARIKAYVKAHPGILDKYYYLKKPQRTVNDDV